MDFINAMQKITPIFHYFHGSCETIRYSVYQPAVSMHECRLTRESENNWFNLRNMFSSQAHEVLITSTLKYSWLLNFFIPMQKQDKKFL